MYHGRFLRSISAASDGPHTYVAGQVSVEMTKRCIYHVDVKVDSFGVIAACQCECAAGEGQYAHCKHVALVLYALTFAKEGILTHPHDLYPITANVPPGKKYTGSPVKMCDIVLQDSENLALLNDFEPRPEHLIHRPEYRH